MNAKTMPASISTVCEPEQVMLWKYYSKIIIENMSKFHYVKNSSTLCSQIFFHT